MFWNCILLVSIAISQVTGITKKKLNQINLIRIKLKQKENYTNLKLILIYLCNLVI